MLSETLSPLHAADACSYEISMATLLQLRKSPSSRDIPALLAVIHIIGEMFDLKSSSFTTRRQDFAASFLFQTRSPEITILNHLLRPSSVQGSIISSLDSEVNP